MAQIAGATSALDSSLADFAQVRKGKDDLEENRHRIERSAQVHALDGEFARTVIEELRVLPKPGRFARERAERQRMLEETSDADLRAERRLRELGDLDAAVAMRLAGAQPPLPEGQRPQVESAVRELLAEQVALLARLGELRQKLMQTLRETIDAERDLDQRSDAARAELNRLLFWIPVPPGTRTVPELAQSLAWTTSPTNWRTAGAVLRDEAMRRPFWPAVALVVAAGLFAGRRRLQRGLVSLAPAAVTYERYRIGHALVALAITLALALPGPIVMWTAGNLLRFAPDAQPFPRVARRCPAASRPPGAGPVRPRVAARPPRRRRSATSAGTRASLAFAARALRRFCRAFRADWCSSPP